DSGVEEDAGGQLRTGLRPGQLQVERPVVVAVGEQLRHRQADAAQEDLTTIAAWPLPPPFINPFASRKTPACSTKSPAQRSVLLGAVAHLECPPGPPLLTKLALQWALQVAVFWRGSCRSERVGRGGEGRREKLNLQRAQFQPGQHRPSGDALPTAADARLRQRTGKALVHEVIGGGGGAALGDNTVQQAVVVGVRRAGVRLGVMSSRHLSRARLSAAWTF
ncbi:hypothetical protein TYRP_010367, partial [Tyrophagus putrescentiae]